MATDEEKEDEKHERVATALENMILLQGMGLLCAVGRYIGIGPRRCMKCSMLYRMPSTP